MKIDATKPEDTWPQKGEIVFDKYCVRYREGLDFVLKDITCKIHPSEKVKIFCFLYKKHFNLMQVDRPISQPDTCTMYLLNHSMFDKC